MLNSERKAALVLVATTMIAALGWIFSKETIQGMPPFGFIGLRFTIASVCLLPLCFRPLLAANLKDVLSAGGVGLLLGSAVMTWISAISISDTLGEGAFIMSLSMLFVPIVAWVMFRQRPQRIFWVSLPIAVAGLACLSLVGGWKQSASQLWFLIAALILALHFNVNSKYSKKLPVLVLTCVQLFTAGCLGLIVSFFVESRPTEIDSTIWMWFALSTLLATSLRYVMQTMGQKFVQAGNAALIMILEPVWTVVLSVLWYGEILTANKLIGCTLILFSLVIYRTGGKFRFPKRG
ncbi:DMT family transporter [Vibrio alfacsensis]|uniref:DMT family transporter n=1 Tax=Vibrio alfacsensis TaxID=1074311 RepID=A0ABN5PIY1_9VIBR|nr:MULTISPECIES: DMT family transporter [Vibrio]AXY03147.1 DMT family transporter [Vibrio alfacsensis]CAE6922728.1 of the drug metabolite transporter (DMT) superfamily [Vibrio sp. B1REV9]